MYGRAIHRSRQGSSLKPSASEGDACDQFRNCHGRSLDECWEMPDHSRVLEINVEQAGPVTIVSLLGDLMGSDVDRLGAELAELTSAPRARLAIDLEKTSSIDSTGLGRLMECVTRSRMRGGHVILVAPTPLVSGVLEVTHLDHWFEICDTVDEARRRLCSED